MPSGASAEELTKVGDHVRGLGFRPHLWAGEERTISGLIGDERTLVSAELA